MTEIITTAFGGKTDQQKALEREQARIKASALAEKVSAIQGDVGSRTRELVSRYGVAGVAGMAGKGL